MTHLNKKRAGDENIGKLIMFSITIIIAVGLVGLITYFYNQSREQAIAGSVLGSSASSVEDIDTVINTLTSVANACYSGSTSKLEYTPLSGVYKLSGVNTTCGGALGHEKLNKVIEEVTGSGTSSVTYKMK